MTHALITGVAGFIGSHLAERLLRNGWSVTGLDRRSPACDPAAAANLAGLTGHDGFHLVIADLSHADLPALAEDAQVVFHLAALPGVRPSWGDRFADYLTANVLATHRLLEACTLAEVPRLVLASSSSVYGPGNGRPSCEDDKPAPASPYGVTKLAAEQLALAHAARPGAVTSVVALRYFTVYGPRQRPEMAISRIMRAAASGTAVPVYGTGVQRRDFTYIDDAVAATVAAATADVQAEVVNVGSGTSTSLTEVLDAISQLSGSTVPANGRAAQPGDVDATSADLTRARKLLDYEPRTGLAEGLRRQWEWLTGHHPAEVPSRC